MAPRVVAQGREPVPCAPNRRMRTVAPMRPANHLDARRTLRPCDYLDDPHAFGRRPARLLIPDGGDAVSAEIARIQHHLVLAWRHRDFAPSAAALARRFGCGKQTISRSVLGHRWMGETVMAAVLHAVLTGPHADRTPAGAVVIPGQERP